MKRCEVSVIKSFKKRIAFLKIAFQYAFKTPSSEIKNIFVLLNFEKPAKNRTYLNIQNSSGGIGVLLGVLINFKREVFPNYDSKKFINFCTQGLEQQLIKPTKQTKRQVKRRVQKRRGVND